jgi:hypothetical protein
VSLIQPYLDRPQSTNLTGAFQISQRLFLGVDEVICRPFRAQVAKSSSVFAIGNYSQGRPAGRNLDLCHVMPASEQTTPCNQYRHLFIGMHSLNTEQANDDMELDIVCQLEVVTLKSE